MKTHNFIVDNPSAEFHKVLYCTKCGYVAWNFNWNAEMNDRLQKGIIQCVEEELLSVPIAKKEKGI